MKRLDSPRFLITRLSHIGDCIHTVPMLCALRAEFPASMIAWVVEQPAAPLIRGHDALDELIVLPRGWLKSPSGVWRLRRKLRALAIDVAIDPQALTKSAILGWLSGARMRLGFAGHDGRELSRLLNNRLVRRTAPHVVDRYLQLLAPLGVESPRVEYRLPVPAEARASALWLLESCGVNGNFAVLNPGAGWASRLWPTDRFAEVARHLGQVHALPSLVTWAGEEEQTWAEEIASGSGGHATVAPPTSLVELAVVLERARLFVGSDTGPLHLAAAMGTRSVSMHGTTPAWQSGPHGAGHAILQEVYHEGTSRQRRRAGNDAMKAISVAQVCAACDEVLAEAQGPSARVA